MRIATTLLILLLAQQPPPLSTQIKSVEVKAGGHPCSFCSVGLPKAIQKANPGAQNVELSSDGLAVTFKPSDKPIDWPLLAKLFKDQNRPVSQIYLIDAKGQKTLYVPPGWKK